MNSAELMKKCTLSRSKFLRTIKVGSNDIERDEQFLQPSYSVAKSDGYIKKTVFQSNF